MPRLDDRFTDVYVRREAFLRNGANLHNVEPSKPGTKGWIKLYQNMDFVTNVLLKIGSTATVATLFSLVIELMAEDNIIRDPDTKRYMSITDIGEYEESSRRRIIQILNELEQRDVIVKFPTYNHRLGVMINPDFYFICRPKHRSELRDRYSLYKNGYVAPDDDPHMISNAHYIPAKVRIEVMNRDKSTCQLCGEKAPDVPIQIDHIVPVSKGGKSVVENLQCLCRTCNLANLTLMRMLM